MSEHRSPPRTKDAIRTRRYLGESKAYPRRLTHLKTPAMNTNQRWHRRNTGNGLNRVNRKDKALRLCREKVRGL